MFDPREDRFPYPEETDGHYLKTTDRYHEVFDAKYPYIDRSAKFRLRAGLVRCLLYTIVFPMTKIRLGLKVEGKEHLKENRELIQQGVLSCSNHIHMWDWLALLYAARPARPYVLTWGRNINGKSGRLVRYVGGIPIPENDPGATAVYFRALQDLLSEGGWVHVYAEGSMWEYYAPIRPFRKGVAYLAVHCGKPVLPYAFSFREPGWIRQKLFRQKACLTIRFGEPLFADPSLEKKERITDLTVRCHEAVCRLAGFREGENLYPAVFDHSKRIDYYTTTYGAGDKAFR